MKTFIDKILLTVIILLSVFTLGILLPIIISLFISITTVITFEECVLTGVFWIITLLGWGCASIYINDIYKQSTI